MASIAGCFILTFRGVSRAAHVEWETLEAHVEGTLERVAGATQFTRYLTRAVLTVSRTWIPRRPKSSLRGPRSFALSRILYAASASLKPPSQYKPRNEQFV